MGIVVLEPHKDWKRLVADARGASGGEQAEVGVGPPGGEYRHGESGKEPLRRVLASGRDSPSAETIWSHDKALVLVCFGFWDKDK